MRKEKNNIEEIIIYSISAFSLFVFLIYILFFSRSFYIKNLEYDYIINFIKSFNFLLASLTIVSCMSCFSSSNKQELFIITLSFIVFLIDLTFGNVDGFIYSDNNVLSSNHILLENSMLRILILLISVLKVDRLKNIILKNKVKSIILVAIIAILMNLLTNWGIIGNKFQTTKYFINYNIFLFLFYLFLSIIYFLKSIREKEYIYAIVSASFFVFSIKWIYYMYSFLSGSIYMQILSISISYIAFMILIFGLVFELFFNVKKNRYLQDENFLFRKIADESIHSCIFIIDKDYKFIYMNNKAKQYFLENEIDIDEHKFHKNEFLEKNILDDIYDSLEDKMYWSGSLELKALDKTINCMVQFLRYDNEISTVVIFRDVTKRVYEQKELRKYEKYIEKENLRKEFFANVSHDLKTPVNIFYSTIQLFDKKLEDDDFLDYYKTHSKSLKNNCNRMTRLINNIIDSTKIDVGFIKPKFENIDIVMVIEEIVNSVVNYGKQKNIKIIFDTTTEEHIIKCDLDMIERIMLNLLSNSIKFTKENGNILVNIYVDNNYVKISIIDDGIGIPIDIQPKIFKRFIKNNKVRNSEGTGIGLSIVESMVKSCGGNIELFSDGKNGTTFDVYLPNEILDEEFENNYLLDMKKVELELSDIL